MKSCVLYYLADTRSPSDIRYVGITRNPKQRLYAHRSDKSNTHKACWVRSVARDGGSVFMTIANSDLMWEQAVEAEVVIIAAMRSMGFRLTNATDGGEGVAGYVVTDEVRALRAANSLGKRHSEDTRAKMSTWQRGAPKSTETKERIAVAHRKLPPADGAFKGVYARGSRFTANIYLGGKQKYLGTFETPELAARAFDAAATEAWGSDVWLNFQEEKSEAA